MASVDEVTKLMAAQIEEERRLKRKRERELEEEKKAPLFEMMGEMGDGNEEDADGKEEWVSIKQIKENMKFMWHRKILECMLKVVVKKRECVGEGA